MHMHECVWSPCICFGNCSQSLCSMTSRYLLYMPLPALLQCLVRRSHIVYIVKNAIFEANINKQYKMQQIFPAMLFAWAYALTFNTHRKCLKHSTSDSVVFGSGWPTNACHLSLWSTALICLSRHLSH